MTARKIKKKVSAEAKDIDQFTLPSPQETAPVDLVSDSSVESTFWHAKSGKIWTAAFGVSIVIALIVGMFIYREGTTQKTSTPLLSAPVEKPQVSPTPIPEEINISKYKIEILNGSGIGGEAVRAKQLLEEEKFIVSSIGNADAVNYQKTIIQAKKTIPKEFLEKLKDFLDKSYVLDDTKELDQFEKSDILVIIGKDKAPSSPPVGQ